MLVVVGSPVLGLGPDGPVCAGLAGRVATAIADAGSAVQLVGRVGDDEAGDALVLALGNAGVGHVAILRDPAHPTPVVAPAAEGLATAVAPGSPAVPDDAAPSPEEGPVSGLPLDAGDISLGLRYLVEFRVVVVTDPLDAAAAAVVAESAAFAGAVVVAVVDDAATIPPSLEAATVLARPAADPDGRFAAVVARYAVALDRGDDPAAAFHAAAADLGWETTTA